MVIESQENQNHQRRESYEELVLVVRCENCAQDLERIVFCLPAPKSFVQEGNIPDNLVKILQCLVQHNSVCAHKLTAKHLSRDT